MTRIALLLAALLLAMPVPAAAQGTPQLLLGDGIWGDPDVALPADEPESSPLARCLADPSDWQSCDLAEQSMREGGLESTGKRILEVGVLSLGAPAADTAAEPPSAQATALPAEPDDTLPVIEADIFFQYDSDSFVPGEEAKVERFATAMRDQATAGISFLVLGHTDSRGSDAYNCRLSARRAAALTDALKARGVTERALIAVGVGEAMPRDAADPAAAVNRRVSFAPLAPQDMGKIAKVLALCP